MGVFSQCQAGKVESEGIVPSGYTFYSGLSKYNVFGETERIYETMDYEFEGEMTTASVSADTYLREKHSVYVLAKHSESNVHLLSFDYGTMEATYLDEFEFSGYSDLHFCGFPGGEVILVGRGESFLIHKDEVQPLPFVPYAIDGGYFIGGEEDILLCEFGGEGEEVIHGLAPASCKFAPAMKEGRFYFSTLEKTSEGKMQKIYSLDPRSKEVAVTETKEEEIEYLSVAYQEFSQDCDGAYLHGGAPYESQYFLHYQSDHYVLKDMENPSFSVDFPDSDRWDGSAYSTAIFFPEIRLVTMNPVKNSFHYSVNVDSGEFLDKGPFALNLNESFVIPYLETNRYRFEIEIKAKQQMLFLQQIPFLYRLDKATGERLCCGKSYFQYQNLIGRIRFDYVDTEGDEILYSLF